MHFCFYLRPTSGLLSGANGVVAPLTNASNDAATGTVNSINVDDANVARASSPSNLVSVTNTSTNTAASTAGDDAANFVPSSPPADASTAARSPPPAVKAAAVALGSYLLELLQDEQQRPKRGRPDDEESDEEIEPKLVRIFNPKNMLLAD